MEKKLKDINPIKTNEAYQKVLYWFFSFPNQEITLTNLSSSLKISKTTTNLVVLTLIKEGFLNKKVYGKAWRITCNHTHSYNTSYKISYNLSMVYEAYLTVLREQVYSLVGNSKSTTLFGSYRKGDDTEQSDIDLAIEVAGNEELKIIELGIFAKFGFRENVKVNLYIFPCRSRHFAWSGMQ